eukprot:11249662-Prorocentrum_lima.AAC.1
MMKRTTKTYTSKIETNIENQKIKTKMGMDMTTHQAEIHRSNQAAQNTATTMGTTPMKAAPTQ